MATANDQPEFGTSAAADDAPAELTMSRIDPCAHETPTPEKIAMGKRMREAREIAGLSLTDAATALNYSQPGQLNLMESGQRMPTLKVLIQCATLYGTTMDFLAGFVQDSDRDPAMALQRHVAAMLHAQLQRIVAGMAVANVEVIREVLPRLSDSTRLAVLAVEASSALETFRKLNPEFDDQRGSATLAGKIELAMTVANQHMANVERAKRITRLRGMQQAHANASAGGADQLSLLPSLELLTQS